MDSVRNAFASSQMYSDYSAKWREIVATLSQQPESRGKSALSHTLIMTLVRSSNPENAIEFVQLLDAPEVEQKQQRESLANMLLGNEGPTQAQDLARQYPELERDFYFIALERFSSAGRSS